MLITEKKTMKFFNTLQPIECINLSNKRHEVKRMSDGDLMKKTDRKRRIATVQLVVHVKRDSQVDAIYV